MPALAGAGRSTKTRWSAPAPRVPVEKNRIVETINGDKFLDESLNATSSE